MLCDCDLYFILFISYSELSHPLLFPDSEKGPHKSGKLLECVAPRNFKTSDWSVINLWRYVGDVEVNYPGIYIFVNMLF